MRFSPGEPRKGSVPDEKRKGNRNSNETAKEKEGKEPKGDQNATVKEEEREV